MQNDRRERLTILFLGNTYNPLSIACLAALVESGHEVLVGRFRPTTRSRWSFLRRVARTRGPASVLDRVRRLLRAEVRLALRRRRVRLEGFASVPELVLVHRLRTLEDHGPNRPGFVSAVRARQVDLIVVAGFPWILKASLLGAPHLGCINVHLSLLPAYRGPHPLYWALANRERVTGATVHYMDRGIDTGNVILQREVPIAPGDTEASLHPRLARGAADLLREALPLLAAGTAPSIPQDESRASYYSLPPRSALAV
jgi:folate-dependent phosphoribosylglycinamide formyltransferase PurN